MLLPHDDPISPLISGAFLGKHHCNYSDKPLVLNIKLLCVTHAIKIIQLEDVCYYFCKQLDLWLSIFQGSN